ncbi:hypothetical protein BURPS305_2880 [Burkholderia pseudomallei 305]|nr:ISBma2, transposase [Burkholderia pseudomallei MSHR346]EBA47604.1 hypothetical protein BURPS305_2880 [Burkholderia pseudomallei 305]EXJ02427.1 transposase [Burkholderia pseudomallei MSHR6137]
MLACARLAPWRPRRDGADARRQKATRRRRGRDVLAPPFLL